MGAASDDGEPPVRIPLEVGTFDEGQHAILTGDGRIELTPIETRLLSYLARNAGKVLPHRRLLEDVWGYAERAESRTVYTSVGRLRRKVERDASTPRHVLAVAGAGYR